MLIFDLAPSNIKLMLFTRPERLTHLSLSASISREGPPCTKNPDTGLPRFRNSYTTRLEAR
jgi:hypothetical protein